MQTILNWLGKYNVSTHSLGIVALALTAAFEGYKPFHDMVTGLYTSLPTAVQVLIGTGGFLFALYKSGALNSLPSPSNAAQTKLPGADQALKSIMFLLLFSAVAAAQTTPVPATPAGFVASSDVLAIGGPAGWSAGNLTTESYDFLDYGTTKSSKIFLQGVELTAPGPGFSLYGGGVIWQPDLSALLKKTNLPAGNFIVFVDGSAGAGIPSTGPDRVSALAGAGLRYIMSDNLTWNTIRFEEVFFGAQRYPAVSTGLALYFGGTPASAAASPNVKKSLLRRIAAATAQTR